MGDVLNSLVCLMLLCMLAPVAVVMRSDDHWPQRIAFTVVAFLLALQVAAPMFDDWLPDATGLQTAFNTVLLLAVLKCRHEVMTVVKLTLGRPRDTGARRRAGDMPAELTRRATEINERMMGRVNGGKGGAS